MLELSLPDPRPVTIDPSNAVLVVVDMENSFLKAGYPHYLGTRSEPVVNKIAELLAKFREAGSNVIFVQSLRAVTGSEFTVYGRDHHLIENTPNVEIVDELAPIAGEIIIPKRSNDSFNHTRMEEALASLDLVPGRCQVVVTGCATDGCVDCAVVGFTVRGYDVCVPVDCTVSFSADAELVGYSHFCGDGYGQSVTPTRSDLISIEMRVAGVR
jgi:nicotinamidase-related amidase